MANVDIYKVDPLVNGKYTCSASILLGAERVASALYEIEARDEKVGAALDYLRQISAKNLTPATLKLILLCLRYGNSMRFDGHIRKIEEGIHEQFGKMKEKNPKLPEKVLSDKLRKLGDPNAHKDALLQKAGTCTWVQSDAFCDAVESIIRGDRAVSKHGEQQASQNESAAVAWARTHFANCTVHANAFVVAPKNVPKPEGGVKLEIDAVILDKENVLKAIVEAKSSSLHLYEDLSKCRRLIAYLNQIAGKTDNHIISLTQGKSTMEIKMPKTPVEVHYVVNGAKIKADASDKISLESLFASSFKNEILMREKSVVTRFAENIHRANKESREFEPPQTNDWKTFRVDVPDATQKSVEDKAAAFLIDVRQDMKNESLFYWLIGANASAPAVEDASDGGDSAVNACDK
eukprot:m.175412 g.175412  ORF g.175412 m.175412 type:complete len:406 (+) comp18352_c0_seq1:210-1427(+)